MKKKTLILTTIAVVLILAIALGFCYIPLPYHHTINAFRIDPEGNRIGNVEITLDGTRWFRLFGADELVAMIGSLDDAPDYKINTFQFESNFLDDYLYYTEGVADVTDMVDSLVDRDRDDVEPVNDYLYRVCVSEDLEQWIISVNTNNESYIHYMGSVSGKKTYEQLADYFNMKLTH